jgi:hypothetical protein
MTIRRVAHKFTNDVFNILVSLLMAPTNITIVTFHHSISAIFEFSNPILSKILMLMKGFTLVVFDGVDTTKSPDPCASSCLRSIRDDGLHGAPVLFIIF